MVKWEVSAFTENAIVPGEEFAQVSQLRRTPNGASR
jgi:hypothetical protein